LWDYISVELLYTYILTRDKFAEIACASATTTTHT